MGKLQHVTAQVSHETHLITSQNLEGGDDLVGRVGISRFPGHEVDEGLERHGAGVVGIHDAHDASELGVTLAAKKHQVNRHKRHADVKTRRCGGDRKVCKTSGPEARGTWLACSPNILGSTLQNMHIYTHDH